MKWAFRVWVFTLALVFTGSSSVFVYATRGLIGAIAFVVICWAGECFAYDIVLRRLGTR